MWGYHNHTYVDMTIEKTTLRDRRYQQVVFWCYNRAHALLLRCVYPLFRMENFPNYMLIYTCLFMHVYGPSRVRILSRREDLGVKMDGKQRIRTCVHQSHIMTWGWDKGIILHWRCPQFHLPLFKGHWQGKYILFNYLAHFL